MTQETRATTVPAPPEEAARLDTEALARRYFDAVAARDPDGMAACWSEDGVEDLVPLGIFRGPEEVRRLFGELFTALPDSRMTVTRITAAEDRAVVEWRLDGTFRGGPFQGVDPNGSLVQLRGADCLEFGPDGLLTRNTAHYDGMAFARDIGMLPPLDSPAERAMKRAFNAVTRVKRLLRR